MRRFWFGRFFIHLLGLAAAAAVAMHPGFANIRPDLGFFGIIIAVLVYLLFAWIAAAPVRAGTIPADGVSHVRGIFRGFFFLLLALIPVVLIFFKTVDLTVAEMMATLPPEAQAAMAEGGGGAPAPAGPPPFDPALIPDALLALAGDMPMPLVIWLAGAFFGAHLLALPALLAAADRFTPPEEEDVPMDGDEDAISERDIPPAGA